MSIGPEVMYKSIPHTFWLVAGTISNGNSWRWRVIAVSEILQPGIIEVLPMNFTEVVENTGSSYNIGDVVDVHIVPLHKSSPAGF